VSLVAKVFVVLNLIVSVFFLVFAMNVWTANTKWQKMYEMEKMQNVPLLAAAQKVELDLDKKLVSLQDQNIAEKTEVTHLKLDKNRIQDDLAQLQVQYASATNEKEILAAKNNEMEREYKRLTDNILKLEDVVHKQQQVVLVERNNALNARNERSDMETELNTVKNTLAALQRDKRAMEEDLALQTSRINRLLEKGVPIADILGEETITQGQVPNAQVLAVRPDVNLVMLSIGSAQNVKPGYRFTISRGDQYVAQVQVEKVYPDMCSARIDPKMSKMAVEVNDDAKSH
jgi:chromosome segregation ATPase